MLENYIIFGLGNGYKHAEEVAKLTNISLGKFEISRFADGEILVRSSSTVRGLNVFLFQSTSNPVNDNLMELLIAIDSLKRASAQTITVFIPYYGYARQDRKAKGREPISSKLVANFLEASGATKVILIDIHSLQTQGFFNIAVDTLSAMCLMLSEYKKNHNEIDNLTIVSPDYGSVKKARKICEILDANLAIVDKRRPKANVVEVLNILGDVENKNCLILDDIIDTGGTILGNIDLLKQKKAKKISVIAIHGVFSNNSIEKFVKALDENKITDLYISDSIQENRLINHPKIHIVNLSPFFASIIMVQINCKSMSSLYNKWWNTIVCDKTKK